MPGGRGAAMRALGNAVPVPLAAAHARALMQALRPADHSAPADAEMPASA